MKRLLIISFIVFLISSCASVIDQIIYKNNPKALESATNERVEKQSREKLQAKEYKLQKQIETDKEFFIQNCYSIDSLQAREECLKNIPK